MIKAQVVFKCDVKQAKLVHQAYTDALQYKSRGGGYDMADYIAMRTGNRVIPQTVR